MENNDFIGRILFYEKASTFFEIKQILPPQEHCESMGDTMEVQDRRTDQLNIAHWVSQIGNEYQLVPEEYPKEKIMAYCKAANAKEKAEAVMMDVEIGLATLTLRFTQ